ncbi:hypothetical protein MMC12_006788 [Toensbergia leucococca]|nr:hypothetical protein [Toensbergia leucococca]
MDKAQQEHSEVEQELDIRARGEFPGTEVAANPPAPRASIPLLDDLSSYLGDHNPLAREVDPATDAVWLLDNTAYKPVHNTFHLNKAQQQPWQAEYIAAFFKMNSGEDLSKTVADLVDKMGLNQSGEDTKEAEATIAERLQPFVDVIEPARWVNVGFPDGEVRKFGPSGRDGISIQTLETSSDHKDDDTLAISTIPPEVAPHGSMITHFAAPEGWLVVSDIDDSIKVTMTPSKIGILRSTFLSTPTPITGMPPFYAHIENLLSPTWFYLSASPYNLYPFLRPFLHAHYPKGTLFLRSISWMDIPDFLIASLTQDVEAYKSARIEKIHSWLPNRKVLCVGDSTQSDPEAYGDICRRHEGWIKAVFIRKVTDVSGMTAEKNSDERFEKAFRGVPRDIWKVFESPEELYKAVDALKGV